MEQRTQQTALHRRCREGGRLSWIQILRASGKTAISVTTKPNRAYYNLKKLDRRVKFRKLKRGTYTYKVKAQTSRGWETLVEQGFTIY